MKWTDEKINLLNDLVNKGLNPTEISNILGVSYKTITNKMFRLKLYVKYKEKKYCLFCNKNFESYYKKNGKFCSKTCSAKFNNKNRKHSEETKFKISLKLKNSVNIKLNKPKKINVKKCKLCNDIFNIKYKKICETCKFKYYKIYRTECNFNFNVYDYPKEYDLNQIKEHGWYSPRNKKNNLYGISKDHIYSVMDGFKNNVDPKIISHPANCELLLYSLNSKKKDKSNITLEELKMKIIEWEKKYMVT